MCAIFISIVHINFTPVDAQPTLHYNIIVPMLSESCIRMNEQGNNTSCPTIQNLITFDKSNQYISGKFIIKNGHWIRTPPEVKNHYMFYGYSPKPVVCVECVFPGKDADSVQIIDIVPNSFTWIDPVSKDIAKGNKILLHTDPYISPDCYNARLSFTPFKMNYTLAYMINGCKGTIIDNNSTITLKTAPFYMDNPYSSLRQQEMLQKYGITQHGSITINGISGLLGGHTITLGDCIHKKCDIKDPYKKKNW